MGTLHAGPPGQVHTGKNDLPWLVAQCKAKQALGENGTDPDRGRVGRLGESVSCALDHGIVCGPVRTHRVAPATRGRKFLRETAGARTADAAGRSMALAV
ncbi:hypothetical protein E2562_006390 [Oryza meyeriana var. granulata]|uniref:Uncharacterized protein n=1 Tax=Oryza meyeriana var. granulata TaxID=110450 RepID=A0A6G1EHR7_9ORYZ|nr:hypothetical protein E2562_006390 [Oryza meyeriana var. granulata]